MPHHPEILSRPASYADLCAVPEHLVAEILDGELVTHPRPAPKHARASSRLGVLLGGPFDMGLNGPGDWWILDEPEIHFHHGTPEQQICVPDLAGWRRETLPGLPDTAWFETVPDWVCEILSPGSSKYDRVIKSRIYTKAGVQYYWLVDPLERTLEACELQKNGQWLLIATLGHRDKVEVAPFAAVPFALDLLWAE